MEEKNPVTNYQFEEINELLKENRITKEQIVEDLSKMI